MKKPYSKLNDFIKNSTYEVHTAKARNRKGKKIGKYLDWKSTVDDWKNESLNDCENNSSKNISECAKETLQEDHPEFCLFGSRCINQAIRKSIDKDFEKINKIKFDEIPDEVIHLMIEKQETEEVVF
jgi:hypothetical protein